MSEIKFSEVKQKIVDKINSEVELLGINEPVTLIDGFTYLPLQQSIGGSIQIGGPAVPMILLAGVNTGRIYYFALKVLLPDLEI